MVHAIHAVAVFFKLMAPSLYHPSYKVNEMWSIVVLNSFNLAMACRYVVHCADAPKKCSSDLNWRCSVELQCYFRCMNTCLANFDISNDV